MASSSRIGSSCCGSPSLFPGPPPAVRQQIPYGLLRDLLAWRFEILESDSQSVAQGKLAAGLAPVLGERAAEYTALIGELIGFEYHDDPHIAAIAGEAKQIRDRAFHALASYFRALQRDSGTPMVLLLDDLHWADEGSLDFINHLAQACGDVPLFILCLTRSTLFERVRSGAAAAATTCASISRRSPRGARAS